MAWFAAAMAVGSAALQYTQQAALAQAQIEYGRKVQALNTKIAQRSTVRQYGDLLRRQQEEQARAQESIMQTVVQAQAALGTARTEAAESGTAGASITALAQDIAVQEGDRLFSLAENQRFVGQQTRSQLDAVRDNFQAQLLSFTPSPVQEPSMLGAGLNAASSGYQAFHLSGKRSG